MLQWPSFASYVISFPTIGIMWINHHSMFQYIRRTDRGLLLLHIIFLLLVSFVPYPTMTGEGRTAALLYGSVLTARRPTTASGGMASGTAACSDAGYTCKACGRSQPVSRWAPHVRSRDLSAFVNVAARLAAYAALALYFALPDRRRPQVRSDIVRS